MDEEAGTPNHPDLWLLFTKSLGLENDTVLNTQLWDATKNLIETFKDKCTVQGTTTGIASLYTYESQIPEIAETKIEGLKNIMDWVQKTPRNIFVFILKQIKNTLRSKENYWNPI